MVISWGNLDRAIFFFLPKSHVLLNINEFYNAPVYFFFFSKKKLQQSLLKLTREKNFHRRVYKKSIDN